MAQTTTTTLATVVPTEVISATILEEARPFNVVAPLVTNIVQPKGEGLVYRQQKLPSTTAYGISEASDAGAVARTTAESSAITIAEVVMNTEVTLLAREASRLGDQIMIWAASAGRAIAQKITGDLCALFTDLAGGSGEVGTTGVNMSVADFVEAMYTLSNANAPGQRNCVLHPRQVADLFNSLTGTGAVYQNLGELIRDGRLPGGTPAAGFVGVLFGVPVYETTEVDEDTDKLGSMFVKEAMGIVRLRPITVMMDDDASKRSIEIVVTTAYGVGEITDDYGVPIETDA